MAQERRLYEVYTADCLYYINYKLGVTLKKRYSEIISPKEEDNRPAQEIVDDIRTRFGLKVVSD